MNDYIIYNESVVSKRTEILFIALTILFCFLCIGHIMAASLDFLASVWLFFFCFFLFYSLNYRILIIRLTSESLTLSFGIFTWTIALNNVSEYRLDEDLPILMKYGGAGIHFMLIHKRYRVSFNFLEYPRVVIGLKRKAGLVRDISFSTCQPSELIERIQGVISANKTA